MKLGRNQSRHKEKSPNKKARQIQTKGNMLFLTRKNQAIRKSIIMDFWNKLNLTMLHNDRESSRALIR